MRGDLRAPARALIVAGSLFWLALAVALVASPMVAAASRQPVTRLSTNTPVPTDTVAATTPTVADTPVPTPTVGATPAATATPVPTAPPPPPPGPQPAGPQVTRVVLAQPTVASSSSGKDQSLTAQTFGTNGLLLSTVLGCITGLLGLVIALVSLRVLIRGGYGPFLRALLPGWLRRKRQRAAEARQASRAIAADDYPDERGYPPYQGSAERRPSQASRSRSYRG